MDFIFKLLFLGGKYISQAAGRTLLEIYHRGVQFGKHVNVQYEKASEIIKPYDNMLELLNERAKEASEDDAHLASISEELKKQLEEHLKRMPAVKYEIGELAAAKNCWNDRGPASALEDVQEGENGLVSNDLEYDKMYTDLYKDLSNVIVENTSVNCRTDQIAVSPPTLHTAFKTNQTSIQESRGTTSIQKLAPSNKNEEAMSREALKDNNGEFTEAAYRPFHFEKYRQSCRCNALPSFYSTDVSYMKYLVDHSPSDSYYKTNAIGSCNDQAAESYSYTKEQNRSSYTNLDEIIRINNRHIIKGLSTDIENRMVLLKKNSEHFKTFEKRLHDRIVKSKVKQIAKDVEVRSSILAQNTSHYNKFENRLEKKLKRAMNKLMTHRTLSSGNVGSSKRELDESIKEIINLLKVNEKAFQKLEQKVTQRLIRDTLNSDNSIEANMKENNASVRYLTDYDKADRKERTEILEINEKVFKKFEKDMRNIVILEKNKPADKEDMLISERLAKYHVNVHNDSTFNESLNMDRLKFKSTECDFPYNQLKTQITKRTEKETLKYRPCMADVMEDACERGDIIEANAKAFNIFESKMNNLRPTKLPKSSDGNGKDNKGLRATKAEDSEADSNQIMNTLKEVLDNSTIFKPPTLNSRVNSTDRSLHLEKIKKVLSTKKKDIISRYISPVKKEINESKTMASISVMNDEPQKPQQKCEVKNEKSPPKTSKEHTKKNDDETKNQKIEGNLRPGEKSDFKLKSGVEDEQETEAFSATLKRLQNVVSQYKNDLSKNSLLPSDNVTSHKKGLSSQHKQINHKSAEECKSGKFKGKTDCKSSDRFPNEKDKPNSSGAPTADLKDFQRSRIPKLRSIQSELRRDQTMTKSPRRDIEIHAKRAKSDSSLKMVKEEQTRDASRKGNQHINNIKETINQLSAKSSEGCGKDSRISCEDRDLRLSKQNLSEIKEDSSPEYNKQRHDNNMKIATSKKIKNHYYVVYKRERTTQERELNCKNEKMVKFASKPNINKEKAAPLNEAEFDKEMAEFTGDKAIDNKETFTRKIAKDSHANEVDENNLSKRDYDDEKGKPVGKVSIPKRTQSETRESDYRIMNASQNILRALKIIEDKLANEEKVSNTATRNSEFTRPKVKEQRSRRCENFDSKPMSLKKKNDRIEPSNADLDTIHKKEIKSINGPIHSKSFDVSKKTDNYEVKTKMAQRKENLIKVDVKETSSSNIEQLQKPERKDNETQYKERETKMLPNQQDVSRKFFVHDAFRKFQPAVKSKSVDIPKAEVSINKSKEGEEVIKPVQNLSLQNHNKRSQWNQSDQNVNVVNELKIPPPNPSISKINEKAAMDDSAKPVNAKRSNSPTADHLSKNELNQRNKNIFAKSSKSSERVIKEYVNDIENCEKTGMDGGKSPTDTLSIGKLKLRKILAYIPADIQAFKVLQNLYNSSEKHKENINIPENNKDMRAIQTDKKGEEINQKITTVSTEDRTEPSQKVNTNVAPSKIKHQRFTFKPFRPSSVDSKKKCDFNKIECEVEQQDANKELSRRHSAIPLRTPLRTEKQRQEVYNCNRNREDAPDKTKRDALPKNGQEETVLKANKENETNFQEMKYPSCENRSLNNKIRSEVQKGSSPLKTGTTKVERTNEAERQVQPPRIAAVSRKSFDYETKEMSESLPQAKDVKEVPSTCKRGNLEPHIIFRRPFPKVNVKAESNSNPQCVELRAKDERESSSVSNSPFKFVKFPFNPNKQVMAQSNEKNEAIAKEKSAKEEITLQLTKSTVPTLTKESSRNTIEIQSGKVIQQHETVNDNLVYKHQKIQLLLAELRKELLTYSKISSEENKPPIRELTDAISKLNSEAKRKEMEYKVIKENVQNKNVEAVDKDQNLHKNNQDADQIRYQGIYQEDDENAELFETTNTLFREAKFSFIPMKNVENYMDPDMPEKDNNKEKENVVIQPQPEKPDPFPQNLSPLLRYFLRKQLLTAKEAPKLDLEGDENAKETLSALETEDDFEISNAHSARSTESVYDRYPLVLKRKPTMQNTLPKGALEWKMRFIQQSLLKGSINENEHYNQTLLPKNRSQSQFIASSRTLTTKTQSIKSSTSKQFFTAIPIKKELNPEIPIYDSQPTRHVSKNNFKGKLGKSQQQRT